MIDRVSKSSCSGCLVCSLICPRNCIHSETDETGFTYPYVDKNKCIECNLCKKVCPILNYKDEKNFGKRMYAAFSMNKKTRKDGSSGGMFETFSRQIIDENGVVFASKFDNDLQLKCFRATNYEEVNQMCKSKYLQSNVHTKFKDIEETLKNEKKVLFCGAPCQVAALKNYLKLKNVETQKLVLIDFFCHGVPSQAMFDKCREYIENKKKIIIKDFRFREKIKNGATPHYYSITYINKKNRIKTKTEIYLKNPFYLGFQKYYTLRESCYNCMFRKGNHQGDITVGDFHEIGKYIKDINRMDGISTVILNTDKGINLWSKVESHVKEYPLDIEQLLKDKVIYSEQIEMTKERESFINDLKSKDFEYVIKKYLNGKKEWKKNLYYHLPNRIRKNIKKVILRS